MSQRIDVDLETDKAHVDGAWVSRDELWERMNAAIAAKDYKNIGHFAAILDTLDQALAGAQTVTLKLSAEHFAKLEAAGQKLGMSASAFARQALAQMLGGNAPQPAPAAPAPVALPAPVLLPSIVAVEPAKPTPVVAAALDESAEDSGALLQPKRRDPVVHAHLAPPPVMTPVANPVIQPPVMAPASTPSVVVDLDGTDGGDRPRPGGDGRRWFNRTT